MTKDSQKLALYNKIRDIVMENGNNASEPNDMLCLALLTHEVLKSHQHAFEMGAMDAIHRETGQSHHNQTNITKIRWVMSTMDWIKQDNH